MSKAKRRLQKVMVKYEEAFIPTDHYEDLKEMPGAPDVTKFPEGLYILYAKRGAKVTLLGFSGISQLDQMVRLEGN